MSLFQLVYVSTMVTDDPRLMSAVLDVTVKNNKRNNITGMLLYADGNIIQVLEGERVDVLATFKAIEKDIRHHGIRVLLEKDIVYRKFLGWSMGVRRLSKADKEGFQADAPLFNMHDVQVALRIRSCQALTLLNSFAVATM